MIQGRHTSDVHVEGLVRALQESGRSASEVARELGWMRPPRPDSSRVSRALRRSHVRYDTAVALCAAIGCDPVDVGC